MANDTTGLPAGATLISGQIPALAMALPPGATLVGGAAATAKPEWPITIRDGEDYADFMKRAVAAGKTVTPEMVKAETKENIKKVPLTLAAAALAGPAFLGSAILGPAEASTAAGGGVLGATVGGAVGGAGTELVSKGIDLARGENVFNLQTAKDVGTAAGVGAATGGAMGLFGKVANSLFTSKIARGAVNESLGATARDVTYGNPAKAILDEKITTPFTGDIEQYKTALRSGLPPEQALVAAGGRTAAVAQKVNQLAPQVDGVLKLSTARIPVADVIDRPLMHAASEIIDNKAMTQMEKDAALTQLGALQQSLKEGIVGDTISPLEANRIKQAIGGRINWAGNIAVTDEVKPAYRAVYGSLKNAVNQAVPEVAQTNERLTNLLSAQTDLEKLMKSEEVGMGKGALGSAVTGIARRAEAVAGRAVPALNRAGTIPARAAPFAGGPIGTAAANLLSTPRLTGTLSQMGGQP